MSNSEDEIDNFFDEKSTTEKKEGDIKKEKIETEIIVGIDLGTTNSCIAIWRNNNLEIIPDEYGNRTIPSVVTINNYSRYIGIDAKNQIEINPENTFYEVKRLIGRKYDDITVKNDINYLTYKIDKDENNNILISNKYTPEEISSMVLTKLKHMAEQYLNRKISKAVITVPAYFNDAQRQATKDASTIAGLECVRIINEPTSSALAYGLEKISVLKNKDLNILIYDLGGGTLDVSLLNISEGLFHVLASTGNTHLGGADFDNRIVTYALNEFKKKYNITELTNLSLLSLQKLKKSSEIAKKVLSTSDRATISVKDFYNDKNLNINITKTQFESLCKDLFILCLKPIEDALKSADMNKSDIDNIILVGGATRMPLIQHNIKLYFNKEPDISINPDEVVATGAAIQGFMISNNDDPFSENIVLLDIIPLSLGVETIGGIMNVIIPRNSVIPITKKKKYTTDTDFDTSVKVKIYEGERAMTRDNFFVGEFELTGIESTYRGIPEIEISFSVDINGIINVTAEDIKNQNKKSIIIKGNKGRLTKEEIDKLIKEAKEYELKDILESEKKQLYYEIDDLTKTIINNVNSNEIKLNDSDKEKITEEINKIINWYKQLDYLKTEKKELSDMIDKIKNTYSTLIYKISNTDNKVKTIDNSNVIATSVFEDDRDDTNDNLDIFEDNINVLTEEEYKEFKQLRDELLNLCYNTISLDNINNHDDIKEYLNDVLLWIHIKEKLSINDLKNKIEEVNNNCSKVYNETIKLNKRKQLEELCYTILSSINSNDFSLYEDKIVKLKELINETLEWIIEVVINEKEANILKKTYELSENIYDEKMEKINSMCTEIYNQMITK